MSRPPKLDWPNPGRQRGSNAPGELVTRSDVAAQVQQALQGVDLTTLVQLGMAGAKPEPGGLNIQHLSRGLLFKYVTGAAASYTITATTQAAVDSTNLGGRLMCTGRPLFLAAYCRAVQRGTNFIRLGVSIDGVEQGGSSGLAVQNAASIDTLAGLWVTLEPQPGQRLVELTSSVDAGNGTIFATTSNFVFLLAVEL